MNNRNNGPEQPSCVLLCGNPGVLDKESVKAISRFYNVVVSGEDLMQGLGPRVKSKKIHLYREDITSENFSRIIYSFSPDAIWYFSGYVDGGNGLDNELKKFEALIQNCVANDIKKLVIISSVNSLNYKVIKTDEGTYRREYATPVAYDCAAFERLVGYTVARENVKTILLRVPFITNHKNLNSYLGGLFEQLKDKKSVELPYNEKQFIDFLSSEDLAKLLVSVTEETLDEAGEYSVFSGYKHTYADLGAGLAKCEPEAKISYDRPSVYVLKTDKEEEGRRLRVNYGFIAADDVLGDINRTYDEYRRANVDRSPIVIKIKEILSRFSQNTLKIAELIILFLLVQLLLKYTTDSVYFKYVDLRLFYVVIMGVTHGMTMGIAAGVLECISLIFAYAHTGVTGTMLFYNVDYWLPFATYLMTGAITGYITSAKDNKIRFMEEESFALQDKYVFLNDVYMSVIDNKEEYKRQILGYQDSFGKIFEAVEKLDSSIPAEIFMNGVNTLEHILNNHTIAIYTMDDYQKYLRLVACSREMSTMLTNSVSVEDFRPIYDTILTNETWKNIEFTQGLPIYAYAIVEQGKMRLMICVFEATPEQLGLYYMNLFTIMCNLIRVSFKRALEYQDAIEDEKYYKGTEVLLPEFFEKELDSQRKMSDAGVASYILVRLKNEDVNTLYKRLQGLIRHSDFVGIAEDKEPYLLFTQTTRDIFKTVGKRLTDHSIEYSIVEGM